MSPTCDSRAPLWQRALVLLVRATLVWGLVVGCAGTPRSPELVSARQARDAGELRGAHRLYLAHLSTHPADEAVEAERQAVADAIARKAREEAATLAAAGGAGELRRALDTLDNARGFDAQGTLLGAERDRIQSRLDALEASQAKLAASARAAISKKQWTQAAAEIEKLRAADPGSELLPGLEKAYRDAYGQALTADFKAWLDEGEVPSARSALEKLEALQGPEAVESLRAVFRERELGFETQSARRDMAAKRYYTAFRRIQDSGRAGDLVGVLEEIRNEGSYFYLDQARLRMDRGETARAYLETLKARALRNDIAGLFEAHREARDAELEQLQTYVAVPTFGSPRSHPDAGAQLSDRLINHLFGVLPFGVQLIERDEIDVMITEQRRSFAEIGDELNLDLIVGGNVSLLQVDRQERRQQGVARVQVGTRREPNPDYEALTRALGPGDPPPKRVIEVPVYESIRYEKGSTTTKGFATVSVRIFDANEAAIVDAEEFKARVESTDEYQDAVPEAGIQGDPIELPTETEVLESLRNDLVARIAESALEHLGARERVYRERVERRIQRREPDLAMLPLASGLLYCTRAELPEDNADCRKLEGFLVRYAEGGFLAGVGSGG